MSVKPININVIAKSNIDAFKELSMTVPKKDLKINSDKGKKSKNTKNLKDKFEINATDCLQMLIKSSKFKNHVELFQSSMMYCLMGGQCIGLFPIVRVSKRDTHVIRYKLMSWRYILCLTVLLGQMIAAALCFYRLTKSVVNITSLGYFSFYASNCITSILFMRIATKWHYVVKLVATSELNEYIDQCVKFKCNVATISILSLAFIEHILAIIVKFAEVTDCNPRDVNVYEQFMVYSYPWLFELNVSYSLITGIFLPILNWVATIIWSYSHLFIICIGFYLTSILEQLNKKILSGEGQYLPVTYWRALREDYNKATRLIRSFDDVINSIVFTSFASNLFFVCLQLYNILAKGIKVAYGVPSVVCPNYPSGLFNGYEHVIYYTFSLIYILARSLAVSLIAAKVHSASLVAAPSLYNVPSPAYCTEVQRFIEQIHGDTVALTGLNFFYITKELVLSVVGTIVTYELVLLQFNDENGQ